jgi:PQQ-dependent dehydrogenase (methanol/ethanol family)
VLDQIDRGNVSRLRPVFSFRSGQRGAQGAAPLVVGSHLYFLTSFPHTLFALDLTSLPSKVSWQVTPQSDPAAEGVACCDRTEHGPVFDNGRLYFSTLDGHVMAVDADTGRMLWDVAIANPQQGETLTSPPTLSAGRVVIGSAGGNFGARGWIVALDSSTGRELWRHYTTGPDQDVGITQTFAPFHPNERGADLGVRSWPTGAWRHGGGSVAGPVLFDSELGLLLHNTGPPAPWNPQQRPGANRWTSGVFAREPQTGASRWFTPLHPHNVYAWANGTANIAVDRSWEGRDRKLLLHADGDGSLYVLDRGTGEILASDRLLAPEDARRASQDDASQTPRNNVQVRDICPSWVGAIGGNPALSGKTGLLFVPIGRLCMDIEARAASYLEGTAFIGANVRVHDQHGKPRGGVVAWDIGLRKAVWSIDENFPVASDALATAGGLVFYGTLDGVMKAVDASTGKLLWQWRTASGIMGQPTTYRGPDGRQYVAVIAGAAGPYGLASQYWIDRRDATAALGLGQAVSDLPAPTDPSGTLYVFGLP